MKTIAEVIAKHRPYAQANGVYCDGCRLARIEPWLFDSSDEHAAHVAQAIRESRLIRTVDGLEALTRGTIILDGEGPARILTSGLEARRGIRLPVRVLWTPGDEP